MNAPLPAGVLARAAAMSASAPDTDPAAATLHVAPPAPMPFFVVGAQRSGTTMLRLMLNAHPRLCVPFESRFIPDLARRAAEFGDLREEAALRRLFAAIAADPFVAKGALLPDAEAVVAAVQRRASQSGLAPGVAGVIDAMFGHLAALAGKARWGDKTPSYVTEMGTLWQLFPGCRFVHLVRDGRDVALSLAGLSWGSRDLVRNAQDWRWKVTLGRRMGEMIPGHYLEVRYEDLVAEPAAQLKRICAFLGEPFSDAMLDYPATATEQMPEQSMVWHRNSVRAPDADKRAMWRARMSAADQRVFDEVAGTTLEAFGYGCSGAPASIASRLRFARYAIRGQA
jgi:hypothetical protein